jgi:hypothetical protein
MTVTRLPFLAHHPSGRPPAGEAVSWSRLTAFPLQRDPANGGTGLGVNSRGNPVMCHGRYLRTQARNTGTTEPPVLVAMSLAPG